MDLTGKWKYKENYGFGIAEGELYLKQEGELLSGKIVFTDKLKIYCKCMYNPVDPC